MIGSSVGNYKITEKIGEGGMGAVFKGIDEMLEREVAIKMLRPELARQPDVVERFRSEAVTLAKLNHPNIATLYSFMRHGEDYFMVMEYVRGNTLEAIIKNFGAISYERAIPLFCQALEGIDHAHKQGIVHRDIKPANVMILESGSVKVMDFGIARMLGSARLTRQGNVVGTVEYMSPEQIKGEEADARSDIYSLGILLYEMLTGRLPFESKSEYELMRLQVEEAPPPPTLHSANIPAPIEQAIMRALAKKKEARYESAGELRAVLLRSLVASTSQLGNSTTGNYAAPTTRVLADSGTLSSSGERQLVPPLSNMGETTTDSRTPSKETVVDRASTSFPTPVPKMEMPSTQVIGGEAIPHHESAMPATQILGGQPEATQVLGGQPDVRTVEATTKVVSFQPPQKPHLSHAAQKSGPQPVPQKAVAASAAASSKSNLKMFVGVGAILLVLAGGSAAFLLKKGNAQPPPVVTESQPETPDSATPDPQTQPPAQGESQATAPTTNPENPLDESANSNANTAKQTKPRKGEKTDQPTDSTEEAKKAEPEQPTTTQPAQQPTTQTEQPKPEPSNTVAKEPEKKEEKKEEKKKGGGVGGFFKKIFGGGEKKKEEKKPPQN
jgi:serine/threonine-protein kinase